MSAGGHMMDMLNRIKYNAQLKKSRRERTKKVKEAYERNSKNKKKSYLRKSNISIKDLSILKARIRRNLNAERDFRKNVSIIVLFVFIIIFIWFVISLFH